MSFIPYQATEATFFLLANFFFIQSSRYHVISRTKLAAETTANGLKNMKHPQKRLTPKRTAWRERKERRKKKFMPDWCVPSNVGKLNVRCVYCAALHFTGEITRCCDKGLVKLVLPHEPQYPLLDLLHLNSDLARQHQQLLARINTLFAFAAKQCIEERIPGRGVPITKVRGSFAHTLSTLREREGGTPRFGALYVLDSVKDATEFRLANERVSAGIDPALIKDLGEMFEDCNNYAKKFKHMKDVLEKE